MASAAFLTDHQFEALAISGQAVVEPFDADATGPTSVDLRTGNTAYHYKLEDYILGMEIPEESCPQQPFERLDLAHGEAAFVSIAETIRIPDDCLGFIYPRSSITRLGLSIPPVYMNPGYSGQTPLTVINNTGRKVTLVPGVRVAQLICARLNPAPSASYRDAPDSKYVAEVAAPSRLHTDAEIAAALDRVLKRAVPDHLIGHL